MRKKLISMILAGVMTLSVCACGNTNAVNNSENESQQTEEVTTETTSQVIEAEKPLYPIVDDPITIKVLLTAGNVIRDGRLAYDKLSEVTGISFEYTTIDKEAIATYLAGGEWDFDLILIKSLSDSVVNDYGVEGGMFVDYMDYLQYMPNLQKTFEAYPTAKKAVTESNGEIYRLPNIEESATLTQIRAYYNPDALEKAGIGALETTEDFYNALKILKEKNNGIAAWCPEPFNEARYFGGWLYSAFGPSVNADFEDDGTGSLVYNRTSDQYKHYLEYLNKLYEEELINQEYLTADTEYRKNQMYSGNTVFWGTEAHSLKASDFQDGQLHLDVLKPLTSEYDNERKVLAQLPVSVGSGFINSKSKYIVEICKLMDVFFAEEEVVEGSGLYGHTFGAGYEGIHWRNNGDGTYDQMVPEGETRSVSSYIAEELTWEDVGIGLHTGYKGLITSTPGNGQLRQYGFRENVFPYACDQLEVFPESYLTFEPEEMEVISNKYVDIQSYVNEMKGKFIAGVEDIDSKWDEYCNNLKKMGIDDVLKVYQSAYDRWNK